MAHFSIDTLRERFENGGVGTETTTKGAEELTQPLGGDGGDSSGELGGSGGTDTEQTDTHNDASGLGDAEGKTKPKSRTK